MSSMFASTVFKLKTVCRNIGNCHDKLMLVYSECLHY